MEKASKSAEHAELCLPLKPSMNPRDDFIPFSRTAGLVQVATVSGTGPYDVMPCTSHQHTSLCISNGWKSPSVSKSPTVNVMKWYQVCTCNVHVMYYSTTYVLSTELGSLGLKSHALAGSWPTAPSATVSPWMWKGLKIMQRKYAFSHRNLRKTGKYSKPNRSTLGNK